ncbi:GAF and ANTAR domain-containing protein [soil metagenome]
MAVHGVNDTSVPAALEELIRSFAGHPGLDEVLSSIATAAVKLVDGVDYADVIVLSEGLLQSITPTATQLSELHATQLRLHNGPCLQAAEGAAIVRCTDLRTDVRWGTFAAAAVNAGVHSVLSFHIYTHSNGTGALNLFGCAPRAIGPEAEAVGALLASVAGIALITSAKERQLRTAMVSRDLIGQAKGILMHHFRVDETQAFAMLKKISQDTNIPVRAITQQIIDMF